MQEWFDKMAAWDARLAEWNDGFVRECRRLRRKRSGLFRRLSAADEEEIAEEARRAVGEEILVEMFEFFDGLCTAYLESELPQDAAKMRKKIGEHPDLSNALWNYAEQAPELIRSKEDARRAELALAAISLDDGRVDLEQCLAALGRVYVAASRAGVDPAPALAAAARVSNPGTGGGGSRTKELLDEFVGSFYFEHNVRPQLSRASA